MWGVVVLVNVGTGVFGHWVKCLEDGATDGFDVFAGGVEEGFLCDKDIFAE